jgi:hypothetical protein
MKIYRFVAVMTLFSISLVSSPPWPQDLGPQICKITNGIYVYVGKKLNSNCGIVSAQEGVVLIDPVPGFWAKTAILDLWH